MGQCLISLTHRFLYAIGFASFALIAYNLLFLSDRVISD